MAGNEVMEICLKCLNPTGRAGKGEDSLYLDDWGPFCENCYEIVIDSANEALIAKYGR